MEISLKKGEVTGCPSLHSSDFADAFFCEKPDFFRTAKEDLRASSTATYTHGEKKSDGGTGPFKLHSNAGAKANGCKLAIIDQKLEIKCLSPLLNYQRNKSLDQPSQRSTGQSLW